MGDEKLVASEKRASKAEESFAVEVKTLEDRDAILCAKEAQLLEVLDHHQTLEGWNVA